MRHENSYLKSQDLLRELHTLPSLSNKVSPIPLPRVPRASIPLIRPIKITRPRTPVSDISEPEFAADSHIESESEESTESPPPSPRALVTESKLLYRDLLSFAARPRVVDLSAARQAAVSKPPPSPQQAPEESADPAPAEKPSLSPAPLSGGRGWVPQHLMPSQQLAMRREEGRQLGRRVRGLAERAGQLGIVKLQPLAGVRK